jgi:hypothetical protein
MRKCRKCGEVIPSRTIISGREHNLQRRKFCLKCSPFGSRNTKPDDPTRPSCRPKVNGERLPYALWSETAKQRNRDMQYEYRQRRLRKLIDLKGGKCQTCGYTKSTRALSFHHRDPQKKKFELNTRSLLSKSWNLILTETNKCDLLCLNCHAELEEKTANGRSRIRTYDGLNAAGL